jgi:hypothetical protein
MGAAKSGRAVRRGDKLQPGLPLIAFRLGTLSQLPEIAEVG